MYYVLKSIMNTQELIFLVSLKYKKYTNAGFENV